MENYPGHDTEFFIVIHQTTYGPFKGLTELSSQNVTPQTPVWYDGLDDWTPAIMAPLTRQLFTPGSEYYRAMAESDTVAEPPVAPAQPVGRQDTTVLSPKAPHPYAADNAGQNVVAAQSPDRPKTYLVWAIAVTVLCNMIAGAIAIIYACKVTTKMRNGDMASAQRCSETAQWWIAISICLGLVMTVYHLCSGNIL